MSEPVEATEEPTGQEPTPTAEPSAETPPEGTPEKYLADLRKENAKHRTELAKAKAEAKANADAAKRLAEIEDQNKTEAQRTTERLATLEAELAAERTAKMRLQVGAAKGLPAVLIERLTGATQDEMTADADALIEALASSKPVLPNLRQGNQGTPGGFDVEAEIARAVEARDFSRVVALKRDRAATTPH